ncbi:alpha/beta fold hydrolase [Sphingobium phenoxybenzoativorans]|uniref:Alpha/beta fold hydrolase n=1 Tax=Sphingobium phenoxybenzoativorans TaxID=1592790 RepID=A0A975Q017_9SPHN|nr:alpha/beta fold hydrolase [Sphingobium phenoxybenzoativorans]QUT03928.1 alpha/beta fold hydrolase [Sphingobium phenoxybenzoativorans]
MNEAPIPVDAAIAPKVSAPQHGPRPLPLFLDILWRETHGDPALRQRAFTGLARYQNASRPLPPPPPRAAASAQNTRLLHYGTENRPKITKSQSLTAPAPVVFIPSLINPPTVLDLSERQSMLRYLAARGHDPWLIDWGTPKAGETGLDLAGHIERKLVPLIESIGRPVILAGYCLGGTLALGLAAIMPVAAVAAIASPWNFDGFPPDAREEVARLWSNAKPVCARLGYVPMEVLQSGFWSLDPARTIRKYAAFGDMAPGSHAEQAFLALEDWANEGPPLTYAAGEQLFEHLYAGNATGLGQWTIGGQHASVTDLPCPTLSIASLTDRIVPAASSPVLDENWTLKLGHVGMIISSRAQETLWDRLSGWLSKHGG